MVQVLSNLLGPIFTPMGVSQADLESYLGMVTNYIWVILIGLAVMIVVMFLAHLAKKGSRHVVRWTAVVAWLALVAVVANLICFGPLKNNVAGFLNASKVELSEETVAASKAVIQKVGEEGMVLVKNDGLLPLSSDTKNLNVFGWGSTNPILGGTGSGSSDGSTAVGILGSLASAGYTTNADLTKLYTDYRADRPTVAMQTQDWTLPEPTVDAYTDAVMSQAKGFSDTALIVISRSGGEGADLPTDMYGVIHGTYNIASQVSVTGRYGYYNGTYTNNGDYDDFGPGEHYLELSVTEENLVEKVCSEFDKVVVIINANNAMELGWVDEYPQIGAVILAPGAGNTGLAAIGEILNGSVNPSGRTADTFVKDLTMTPTWNNFGNFAYTNVDDLKDAIAAADPAYEGNIARVNYVEGIYVGYKFYETAVDDGFIDEDTYWSLIQYPFGYGLSYTTFTQSMSNLSFDGSKLTFDVTVTNTGSVAGKDVVEVYLTAPYTNGGIEKASASLIDFGKTSLLAAGASETLSFSIARDDLMSYDSEGIKVAGGGYILEAGDYTVSIRSDSHTVLDSADFTVDADVTGRDSDLVPAVNQFEDYARGEFTLLSRADGFANYGAATAAPSAAALTMSPEVRSEVEKSAFGLYDPTLYDDPSDVMPTLGAKNGLKLADLRGKSYDDPQWELLLDQLSFDDMALMINLGGWQTAAIDSVGKVATSDCDGPAGLNNFITGNYGTAYPAEVLMAQTWNQELLEEMGSVMAQEYADVENWGWYGPAMNTHRNAFAGRNFEYFSEDGVLGGKLASAEVNGASTKGIYPYIKHFALNDQEGNRCAFLLTFSSEQAIREIYLKPFEIVVKNFTGTPLAVMSSFNWIGTMPADGNPNLLKNVLRGEWGFVGMVETDYDGSYGYMISDHCVRSGNDLMLGFASAASNQFTDQSATAALAMRQACKNILYTIGNSGAYANGDASGGMDNMTRTFLIADIACAAVLLLIEIIVLARWAGKKKKAKAAQ